MKRIDILNTRLPYAVYLPGRIEAGAKLPCIIFLHGHGESGANLKYINLYGIPRYIEDGNDLPFIVFAPQCPDDKRWEDLLNEFHRFCVYEITKYPTDRDRIYLTGYSMGGQGTWQFVLSNGLFAACAPVAGRIPKHEKYLYRVREIHRKPIWAFHGTEDETVPIENSDKIIGILQQVPAPNIRYSRIKGADHFDICTLVYYNEDLYTWFLNWTYQPRW